MLLEIPKNVKKFLFSLQNKVAYNFIFCEQFSFSYSILTYKEDPEILICITEDCKICCVYTLTFSTIENSKIKGLVEYVFDQSMMGRDKLRAHRGEINEG